MSAEYFRPRCDPTTFWRKTSSIFSESILPIVGITPLMQIHLEYRFGTVQPIVPMEWHERLIIWQYLLHRARSTTFPLQDLIVGARIEPFCRSSPQRPVDCEADTKAKELEVTMHSMGYTMFKQGCRKAGYQPQFSGNFDQPRSVKVEKIRSASCKLHAISRKTKEVS